MGNGINGSVIKYFEEILTSGGQNESMEDPYSFVRFLRSTIEAGLKDCSSARILKSMFGYPYTHLLWREALLDKFCSENPVILMCQFDSVGISSEDLISLFKTHSIIVFENTAYDSSFYTRPDRILSKLKAEHNTCISLTPREKVILRYITNGYSNSAIAEALSISIKTVEAHRTHIMKKLNINKSINLMRFAIRNRIV
jgi:DNA-binding CsgD family transcriptional regulator